jgi:hypothetical protein
MGYGVEGHYRGFEFEYRVFTSMDENYTLLSIQQHLKTQKKALVQFGESLKWIAIGKPPSSR